MKTQDTGKPQPDKESEKEVRLGPDDLGIKAEIDLSRISEKKPEMENPEDWLLNALGLPKDFSYQSYAGGGGSWRTIKITGTFEGRELKIGTGANPKPNGTIDGVRIDPESAQEIMDRLLPLAEYYDEYKRSERRANRSIREEYENDEAQSRKLSELEKRLDEAKESKAAAVRTFLERRLEGMGDLEEGDKDYLKWVIDTIIEMETAEFEDFDNLLNASVTDRSRLNPKESSEWMWRGVSRENSSDMDLQEIEAIGAERERKMDLLSRLLEIDRDKGEEWGDPIYGWTDLKAYSTALFDIMLTEDIARRDDHRDKPALTLHRNSRFSPKR